MSITTPSLPRGEDTRSVPGWPGYRIDAAGTVYGKRSGRPLRSRLVRGVPCVDLSPRPSQRVSPWVPVHILVARAFVPIPRPLYRHREVGFHDDDPRNIQASNLFWIRSPPRESR